MLLVSTVLHMWLNWKPMLDHVRINLSYYVIVMIIDASMRRMMQITMVNKRADIIINNMNEACHKRTHTHDEMTVT